MLNATPMLQVIDLDKSYGRSGAGPMVLENVSLQIDEGSFTCIVGPSGCGKSTLLNILAGFEKPNHGQVLLRESPIQGPGPDRVVVFQNASAAIFPWLTSIKNVSFGLKWSGKHKTPKAKDAAVEASLDTVGLWEHRAKYPNELSGGMQQRLQLARALAMDPDVLLMDEPFGALDALTREILSRELIRVWNQTTPRKTIVFITHDIDEALRLGTRVIVLSPEAHGIVGDFDASGVGFDEEGSLLTSLRGEIRNLLGKGAF